MNLNELKKELNGKKKIKKKNNKNSERSNKSQLLTMAFIKDNTINVNGKYLKNILIDMVKSKVGGDVYLEFKENSLIIQSHCAYERYIMEFESDSNIKPFTLRVNLTLFKKVLSNFKIIKKTYISLCPSQDGYLIMSDGNKEIQINGDKSTTNRNSVAKLQNKIKVSPAVLMNMIKLTRFSATVARPELMTVSLRNDYTYATNGHLLGLIKNPDGAVYKDDDSVSIESQALDFLSKFKVQEDDIESVTVEKYSMDFLLFEVKLSNGFTINKFSDYVDGLLNVESVVPEYDNYIQYRLNPTEIESDLKALAKLLPKNDKQSVLSLNDSADLSVDKEDISMKITLSDKYDKVTDSFSKTDSLLKIGINAEYLLTITQFFKELGQDIRFRTSGSPKQVMTCDSYDENIRCLIAPMKLDG